MTTTIPKSLHERVAKALDGAGDLTGEALITHIERAYANDPELIAEVRSLLGTSAPVPVLDTGGSAAAHELARQLHERLLTSELFTTGGTPATRTTNAPAVAMPERVGAYQVVRELGHGGMGVVYEAIQASPKRRVAIKMLSASAPTRSALARFRQEAELLGRLKHPGIAQVFEAATDPGSGAAFFAMEYIDGQSLTLHAQNASLGTLARVELLARVCDAVQHAHQAGVIHRDLKPSNILVEQSPDGIGHPKVLDFGVAKLTSTETPGVTMNLDAGRIIGTLGYMPPEALDLSPTSGGQVPGGDTRGDVYSLGVLLFELLTGELPIPVRGASLTESARRIREQEPAPIKALPPGPGAELRTDLIAVVRKALEKDPSARYPSAAELAADLRRCLRHEPVLACPPSALYALRKFVRRRRGISALVASAAVALVIAGAITFVQYLRAEKALVTASAQRTLAQQKQAEAERGQYRVSLAAADGALRASDTVRARRVLEEAPEHLRGWEWRYLWQSANAVRVVALGEPVADVAMIGASTLAISESLASPTRSLVWDVESGKVVRAVGLRKPSPLPNRSLVVGVDGEGMMSALDPTTGLSQWRLPPSEGSKWLYPMSVLLDAGTGEVAHGVLLGEREIVVAEGATGRVIWRRGFDHPTRGMYVFHCKDPAPPVLIEVFIQRGELQPDRVLLDARTGETVHMELSSIRYSRPVVDRGTGVGWVLRAGGTEVLAFRDASPDAIFSGGGMANDFSAFAVGDTRGGVHIYSIEQGEPPRVSDGITILAGDGAIRSVAFTPGNNQIVVVDATGRAGIVSRSLAERPRVISAPRYSVRGPMSPDRTRLLTYSWGSVECYDTLLGVPLWRKNTGPTQTSAVAWSPDSSTVIWFGGAGGVSEFYALDARTGTQRTAISDSPVTIDPNRPRGPTPWGGRVAHAVFSREGDRVLIGIEDGSIRVLSASDWSLFESPRAEPAKESSSAEFFVRAMVPSPDGTLTLQALQWSDVKGSNGVPGPGSRSRVIIRDTRTLEPRATLETEDSVISAAWYPDGDRIVLGLTRGRVAVWKLARDADGATSLVKRWEASLRTSDNIRSVAVSPDGERIIAGGLAPALHFVEASAAGGDDLDEVGGQLLSTLAMPVADISIAGFADPDTLIVGGEQTAMIVLDASEPSRVGERTWNDAGTGAWPADMTRPASIDEARWAVDRADKLVRQLAQERMSAAVLAQRAAAATNEPLIVRKLAEIGVRRLGAQLNWTNSAAIELLRDRSDDPDAMATAAGMMEEIVAIKPHTASLRINLSSALTNLGRHEEAIAQVLESERITVARGMSISPQRKLHAIATYRKAGKREEATRRLDEVDALVRSGNEPADVKESLQAAIAEERRLLAEAQLLETKANAVPETKP